MIIFAILAHDREDVLQNQIQNIRRHNPNSMIVLYNGGTNPAFARNLGIPICPYSRPLQYGRLERYFYDVMRWLVEAHISFDYLVSIDSDVMFVNRGYEAFLKKHLKDHDCAGVNMGMECSSHDNPHWYPGQTLWREWWQWQPFFGTSCFCGTLNPMQVYKRKIVKKMVASIDHQHLERLLSVTQVFALEEMLHATLALRCGGKPRMYPQATASFTRVGNPMTLYEVQMAKQYSEVYFVHPVNRDMFDPARQWIANST